MPEHVGLVKYGFLVISLLVFFTGNLPKRITFFFSEFAFRLNSSPTNVYDGRW